MRLAVALALALGSILLLGQVAAQDRGNSSQAPTAPVAGRVIDAESGAPIPNARVSTSVTGVGYPVVLSDAEGRFSFQMPSALRFIAASKTGFTRQEVAVAPNAPIDISLTRASAVSGHVTDENGEPAVGVRVTAHRIDQSSNGSVLASADSDDRGEYRIGGLGSEPVVLSTIGIATLSRDANGFTASAVPIYFPGTAAIDEATKIMLKAGEERSGIDFVMSTPAGLSPNVLPMLSADGSIAGGRGALQLRISGPPRIDVPVKGTAVLRGRVLSRDGRPVPRAEVRLTPTGFGTPAALSQEVRTARTDADGVFTFTELPAGNYQSTASKPGYFQPPPASGSGARPSLAIAEGEKREGIDFTLERFGAIEGRVVDERGDPLQGALVQLMTVRYENGRRTLSEVNIPARTSDDRGYYRLHSIRPGQYIVSAAIGDVSTAELPQYARAFYPGTSDAALAQYLDVRAGAEISGVELPLTRIRTARVSGTMLDGEGRPTMGGSVKLVPSASSVVGVSMGARIESDGDFEFVNVSPGQYVIQISRGRTNNWTEGDFVAYPVSISDADVTGLVMRALPPSTISGRITFDVNATEIAVNLLDIVAVPVDPLMAPSGNLASARISPRSSVFQSDWIFEMGGITGVRRLLATRLPRGWALQAVRVNGIDVTDRPLQFGGDERSLNDVEIVITDRVSTLNGTVVDTRAALFPGAAVVVFAIDRENWYPSSRFLRRITADAAGRFTVQGLPAGTYHVAAVPRLPSDGADAWQDPAYLESLRARASTVSMMENQATAVRLQVPR